MLGRRACAQGWRSGMAWVVVVISVVAGGAGAWLPRMGVGQTMPAATKPVESDGKEGAKTVYVGVYVNAIRSVDLKANAFALDFWVWFRWKMESPATVPAGTANPGAGENAVPLPPAFDPLETFEIINGTVDAKESVLHDVIETPEGKFHYVSARCAATITKFFDISRFPLDAHTLALNIEDAEREELRLVYVADQENTGLSPEVKVPGWDIRGMRTRIASNRYETNYGNISLPTGNASVYSRFGFEVDLVRPGAGYFFKLFWSLFLATVIALLAFLIDPIDLDPRFGLGVGAIFAAIASAYVISSALPESNQYTLADKMNMLAVGVIFTSILQSVVSLRLWKSGQEGKSKLLDKVCFYTMLPGYALASSVITMM